MKKVKLIVTGKLEHEALKGTLECAMLGGVAAPPRVINALPAEVSEPASRPPGRGSRTNANMLKLANQVVKLMLGLGVDPVPEDTLLLIIGDVEMYYLDQPHELTISFQESMNVVAADRSEEDQLLLRGALGTRCSYHLFRPMVEATFFGDAQALRRAGVGTANRPQLKHADVEEFECDDLAWLPFCTNENDRKAAMGHDWWRHERHAKEYLIHLADSRRGGLGYSTNRGITALSRLDFPTVVNSQPSPYLRALFDDLADWLGVPNPLGPTNPLLPRPPTALCTDPGRLLRNIPTPPPSP